LRARHRLAALIAYVRASSAHKVALASTLTLSLLALCICAVPESCLNFVRPLMAAMWVLF